MLLSLTIPAGRNLSLGVFQRRDEKGRDEKGCDEKGRGISEQRAVHRFTQHLHSGLSGRERV